jgi:hypothetical protein
MTDVLHLGDEVEIVSDSLAAQGAPRGSVGVIVDDWADGSNDVEVRDQHTGEVVARVRAGLDEIRRYTGPEVVSEPRKHGILFGRGDDLGAPVGDPPSPPGTQFGGMPWGGTNGPWYGSEHPPEGGQLEGDTPWELKDAPANGPVFT